MTVIHRECRKTHTHPKNIQKAKRKIEENKQGTSKSSPKKFRSLGTFQFKNNCFFFFLRIFSQQGRR